MKNISMPKSDSAERIRQIPLFAGLSEPVLCLLEAKCSIRRFEKDVYIFFRGDPADYFYLLLDGEVVIILANVDGRELIINEMHSGDFFGELGLLTGQARSASAVARRDCSMLVLPRQPFLDALDQDARLTRRILEGIATRLSRTSDFQNSLAFLDAEARLAWILLELDRQNEDTGYITVSQDDLARRTGLIRQTVAKTLGQWRRKGWLLTGRGHIVLLNHEALQMLFNERSG
jgi:CRP/FNR family transcriptional regulator, cyclic AMP receptor protein